ncbi:hypothetical protein ABPG75_002234 [Micractinium tetrahymenae]
MSAATSAAWAARPAALRLAAEAGAAALAAAAVSALPRIPQPASYHSFAGDSRSLLGIPHGQNVLSNAAIAAPGVAGLWALLSRRGRAAAGTSPMPAAERVCWVATHLGMVLAAAGSACYHLSPNIATLAWDRLGMCCTFASLLAAVMAERRSAAAGLLVLPALLAAACGSVLWWQASEAAGRGDLRWYGLVQGLTAAGVGYHALAYPSPRRTSRHILTTLALYAAAIACDRLDWPVYLLTLGMVSGHTLKHLLAGAAGWPLVAALGQPVGPAEGNNQD